MSEPLFWNSRAGTNNHYVYKFQAHLKTFLLYDLAWFPFSIKLVISKINFTSHPTPTLYIYQLFIILWFVWSLKTVIKMFPVNQGCGSEFIPDISGYRSDSDSYPSFGTRIKFLIIVGVGSWSLFSSNLTCSLLSESESESLSLYDFGPGLYKVWFKPGFHWRIRIWITSILWVGFGLILSSKSNGFVIIFLARFDKSYLHSRVYIRFWSPVCYCPSLHPVPYNCQHYSYCQSRIHCQNDRDPQHCVYCLSLIRLWLINMSTKSPVSPKYTQTIFFCSF